MLLLELFSGKGSIGRAFSRRGFDVVSVDIDRDANPSHVTDILNFAYKQYPPGHFDAIWACPPCTMYSRARTTAKTPRDLEGADRLVSIALRIIAYFHPKCWALENAGSGLRPGRVVVEGLPCTFVTYCKYADDEFPKYTKITPIWHNLNWEPQPVCCKASPCPHVANGRHPVTAQRAPSKVGGVRRPTGSDKYSLHTLYSMPPSLCDEIADGCWQSCK